MTEPLQLTVIEARIKNELRTIEIGPRCTVWFGSDSLDCVTAQWFLFARDATANRSGITGWTEFKLNEIQSVTVIRRGDFQHILAVAERFLPSDCKVVR